VPVLHIVEASARQVRANDAATQRVGVLSTEGTHQMDIYRSALQRLGLDTVSPTPQDFRTLISPAIAHVKANRIDAAQQLFDTAANRLLARGAQQIILGCTEIPLGMVDRCRAEPRRIVDSTRALVTAVLEHFAAAASSRAAC
jgi:aspartate racemase